MTDPKRFIYLVNNLAYDYSPNSPALQIFRGYHANDTHGIIPSVVAWPHATDTNGVAFPSGLVGVRRQYIYSSAEATNDTTTDFLVAVPDTPDWTLYTPRLIRDHNKRPNAVSYGQMMGRGQSSAWNMAAQLPGSGHPSFSFPHSERSSPFDTFKLYDPYRIRTGAALTSYYWMPENACNNGYVAAAAPTAFTSFWSRKTAGFRYVRFISTAIHAGPLTIEVRYNLDGSQTGSGTNVLWTTTVGSAPYDTGYLIHDGVTNTFNVPTLGNRMHLNFVWPYGTSIQIGPRLDIPFPFTATGIDNLIAPGGVWIGAGVPGYP